MKRLALLLALFPVLANAVAPTSQEAAQAEQNALVDQLVGDIQRGKGAEALRTIDGLLVQADNPEGKAYLKTLRGMALLATKKPTAARLEFEEGASLAPHSPDVPNLRFLAGLATGAREEASLGLDRLIAAFPDVVREIPPQYIWQYFRMPDGKGLKSVDDQRVALAQLGFGGNSGDEFTALAVGVLMKRGSIAEAKALVAHIDDRGEIFDLLVQKKFAPIWEAIEAHAGPRMNRIDAEAVRLAKIDFAESPNNSKSLRDLIAALRMTRRYQEAIDAGSNFAKSSTDIAKLDEDGVWAVNNHAWVLYGAGRFAEGDARFASLIETRNESWIVSMTINRLSALVNTGQYDQASKLIAETEASARLYGNAYARQLVRGLKMCTLHRLGRTAEAKAILPEVKAGAKDARAAAVDDLLCIGEIDAAETLVLEGFADEAKQGDLVSALQRRQTPHKLSSEWRKAWLTLRDRPAVSAAFDKVGRDLPESMYPAT